MSTTDPERMAQPGAVAKTGLIGYFAGNPVAANLLMLVLVAGGIASGYRLAVQHFPEIDLRTVTVTVRFPGASPQEVEQDINRRVEESVIGLAGVFGVVVNDALVLLDRYNVLRRENEFLPAIAAASAAARHRFRAVFLTSATTILGLSPLLYERSDDLLFVVPFVVSMVGGLILSGAFILFILPALVMIAEGAAE